MVEDEWAFRLGIESVLDTPDLHQRVRLLGYAGTADEARIKLRELRPDLVLLDLRLPDGRPPQQKDSAVGLALIAHIKRSRPHSRILVLSNYLEKDPRPGNDVLFEAIQAGAHGYITKGEPFKGEDLARIIERVNGGEVVYGDVVAQRMREAFIEQEARDNQADPHRSLDDTESKILGLRAEGMGQDEIVKVMGMQHAAVRKIESGIVSKLQRLFFD